MPRPVDSRLALEHPLDSIVPAPLDAAVAMLDGLVPNELNNVAFLDIHCALHSCSSAT